MKLHQDAEKIKELGGSTKLGRKLGVSPQRIQNWMYRGIPARVLLDSPQVFNKKLGDTNCYYRPVTPPKGELISDRLKESIARKYMKHDGLLPGSVTFGKAQIWWLKKMDNSGIKEANELIDAINEHGEIEVWIETN